MIKIGIVGNVCCAMGRNVRVFRVNEAYIPPPVPGGTNGGIVGFLYKKFEFLAAGNFQRIFELSNVFAITVWF